MDYAKCKKLQGRTLLCDFSVCVCVCVYISTQLRPSLQISMATWNSDKEGLVSPSELTHITIGPLYLHQVTVSRLLSPDK